MNHHEPQMRAEQLTNYMEGGAGPEAHEETPGVLQRPLEDFEQHLRHVDQMVFRLRQMRQATDRAYRLQRDSRNLNDKDMAALFYLSQEWKEKRIVAPKDVAAHLGFSSATTTSVLDRLEADGYLRRRPSATDRRGIHLEPAESLPDWLEQHPSEILRTSFLEVAEGIDCKDVDIIERYFSAVLENLNHRLP
ncbi:MarR family winged helix-turn-helix transcriptional regulator [Arthrobacter sp. N1]|uniref:MarR family winged helix-turn-helix transcriptional regulator n=1 Tax=Arthrobacter sp. N1 TaxID=619291 RepID=UPI003BB0B624